VPSDAFYRFEQKLVDTLIVADLAALAHATHQVIALASSDDDLWPGILLALELGSTVLHLQHQSRKPAYRKYATNRYHISPL
jgi:uncharacterized LabA/DUF88 family protein